MKSYSRVFATWARGRREAVTRPDDRPPGDTDCRNCGASAPGAYCPACGQETRLALPKATQFLRDAAGRYVALDGRMWRTLVPLLLRPGFLTREYLAGRRKRYIRPARLVLVMALLLFAVARYALPENLLDESDTASRPAPASPPAPSSKAQPPQPPAASRPRVSVGTGADAKPTGAAISFDGEPLRISIGGVPVQVGDDLTVHLEPEAGVGGPFTERLARRVEAFNRLERRDKVNEVVNGMLRFGPYALIALLPAFALLMQALHPLRSARHPGRPRRYAEHLVYGAHNHAFVALVGTVASVVQQPPLTLVLVAWTAAYLPWSMRAVYGGRWSGVFARAAVAIVAYAVIFAMAVTGLVLAAVVLR